MKSLRWKKGWHAFFTGFFIAAFSSQLFGQTEFDEATLKGAKREGKINYYGAPDLGIALAPVFNLFHQRYGVEMNFTGGRGRENYDRILAEQRAGRYVADVMSTGPTSMSDLKWRGVLASHRPPNLKHAPEEFRDPDNTLIPVYLNIYGLLVNTSLVKRDEEPKSWKDLLDPKWKGKILADDPRGAGGGNTWFIVTYKTLGGPFLEELAKQNLQFRPQYLENEKSLARGEFPVYLPALAGAIARLKGAPVKWITPSEGVAYIAISQGLVKNAPHPNAAKIWANFQIGDEAQKALGERGNTPVRADVPVPHPELLLKGKKLLGTTTEDDLKQGAKIRKLTEQIFFAR